MKNFTSLYGPLEALKQKGRDWTHQILLLSRTPINHSTIPQSSSFKGKSILTKLLLQVREREREKYTWNYQLQVSVDWFKGYIRGCACSYKADMFWSLFRHLGFHLLSEATQTTPKPTLILCYLKTDQEALHRYLSC